LLYRYTCLVGYDDVSCGSTLSYKVYDVGFDTTYDPEIVPETVPRDTWLADTYDIYMSTPNGNGAWVYEYLSSVDSAPSAPPSSILTTGAPDSSGGTAYATIISYEVKYTCSDGTIEPVSISGLSIFYGQFADSVPNYTPEWFFDYDDATACYFGYGDPYYNTNGFFLPTGSTFTCDIDPDVLEQCPCVVSSSSSSSDSLSSSSESSDSSESSKSSDSLSSSSESSEVVTTVYRVDVTYNYYQFATCGGTASHNASTMSNVQNPGQTPADLGFAHEDEWVARTDRDTYAWSNWRYEYATTSATVPTFPGVGIVTTPKKKWDHATETVYGGYTFYVRRYCDGPEEHVNLEGIWADDTDSGHTWYLTVDSVWECTWLYNKTNSGDKTIGLVLANGADLPACDMDIYECGCIDDSSSSESSDSSDSSESSESSDSTGNAL